jgi:hypothetical protein
MPSEGSLPGCPLIELNLVAVLIEVFVQQELLISVDPVRWSAGRMDGGWLMGFADVVQDAVDGSGLGDGRSEHPPPRHSYIIKRWWHAARWGNFWGTRDVLKSVLHLLSIAYEHFSVDAATHYFNKIK